MTALQSLIPIATAEDTKRLLKLMKKNELKKLRIKDLKLAAKIDAAETAKETKVLILQSRLYIEVYSEQCWNCKEDVKYTDLHSFCPKCLTNL